MNSSRIVRALMVAALAMALASCIESRQPALVQTPPVQVRPTPWQPSATRAATAGPAHLTLGDKLASLSGYRATFTLTATGSISGTPGTLNAYLVMVDERSRTPDAQRIVYTYSDTLHLDDDQYTEQVRLGNSSFLVTSRTGSAQSCIAQPIRQAGQWELIPFSYSDLGALGDAHYVGDETLVLPTGSLRTRHYAIERSVVGNLPAGHADVWIAADGGYVVKMHAEASGRGPFEMYPQFEGRLVATYQVGQINQAISISPPAVCTGNLPILPGAGEMSIVGNAIAYKVESSVSAVVAFYTREMRARGWASVGEPTTDQGLTTIVFQQGGQTANVLLASSQGGFIQVMIIVSPSS